MSTESIGTQKMFSAKNVSINGFLLFLFAISFSFCSHKAEPVQYSTKKASKKYAKNLEIANRELTRQDSLKIARFVAKEKWNASPEGRGIWLEKLTHTQAPLIEKDNIISLKYDLSLLGAYSCYNSDSLGLKTFRVGQGGVESGLEDAVLLLRKGEKARVIIPPYLAHGLIGDNNRIPPRAIIVYEIEVVGVKR